MKKIHYYRGHPFKVLHDDFVDDPADGDCSVGTLVTSSKRYLIGTSFLFIDEAVRYICEATGTDLDEEACERDLSAFIRDTIGQKAVILPVYMYDHGGVSLSTERGTDHWDTSQIGYIFCPNSKAESLFGPDYVEATKECLKEELVRWGQYASGDVWRYDLDPLEGSVGGFYGEDDAIEAAHEAIDDILDNTDMLPYVIYIDIEGGLVDTIQNIPPGYSVHVKNYDTEDIPEDDDDDDLVTEEEVDEDGNVVSTSRYLLMVWESDSDSRHTVNNEHQDHIVDEWIDDVKNHLTTEGYHEWVLRQIQRQNQ